MFHSTTGLIHLLAALLTLLTGTIVLLNTKGGPFHRRVGYVYLAAMLLLNGTAFAIYHLFGRFGPFHGLALVSLTPLTAGMVPAIRRNHIRNWLQWHYYFMNWSVVGLYAAFWAETLTRTLPMRQFWPIVLGATAVTCSVGAYLIRRHANRLTAFRAPGDGQRVQAGPLGR